MLHTALLAARQDMHAEARCWDVGSTPALQHVEISILSTVRFQFHALQGLVNQ